MVDSEDYDYLVAMGRWHVNDSGYAVQRNRVNGKKKTVRMHRVINQTPQGLKTDHKNRNRLDNRKKNLRSVTPKVNSRNRLSKGYTWDKSKKKWMTRYRGVFYGRYKTMEEAKRAHKLASSGVPYIKSRRKYWQLPRGVSKQFGRYRVRPQSNGKKYWLGGFETLDEAVLVLEKWQKERIA